jgi:hypothetical protein
MSVIMQHATPVFAANDHQPFDIPSENPGEYNEIKKVIIEGKSNDPDKNIHANLEEAMSGGWDWDIDVNGVFEQQEFVYPYPDEEASPVPPGDRGRMTIAPLGLIPKIEGVPGRDTEKAFGNIRSGLGERRETGGESEDISYSPRSGRRFYNSQFSGFDYPDNENTCGLTTVCRPAGHRDARQLPPPGYQNAPRRDRPPFFCQHPCQRPLDDKGKPDNWDEEDSTAAECGNQDPYPPEEDLVKYSCGGKVTKGPGEGFCGELNANGQLGGVCQDMNSWVYILWSKLVHICLVPTPTGLAPVPIYLKEKGECGFPAEIQDSDNSEAKREDGFTEDGTFECCSDDPYPGGGVYDYNHKGESCIQCSGEGCRLHSDPNEVIVNDLWLSPFPADLPGGCLIGVPVVPDTPDAPVAPEEPEDPEDPIYQAALAIYNTALGIYNAAIAVINAVIAVIDGIISALIALGFDPENLGVNIGEWSVTDDNLRQIFQDRDYISFFREYSNGSYERSDALSKYVSQDDFKKENIPVACYGMYDLSPEDAKSEKIENKDKRCTIAAYYRASDGDGQGVNFWNMKESQKGKALFKDELPDNPFNDPVRPFDKEKDLWWPQLKTDDVTLGAFSMLNDKVFSETFYGDFSFALLATDSAQQRAIVQLDTVRHLSSGALIRTPDDTITIEKDPTKERRTFVEWWHMAETEMHKSFTPPAVRMLLPTTWTIDLNPLDPLYTPPKTPEPGDLSPDIRSEPIEVQVQAQEDLLGTITSFMERALLLRIEGEPVPIVVPIINATELRAIAQGWETWARKQDNEGLGGVDKAKEVSRQLRGYADQADKVRILRAELPRYAGAMLKEQRKVSKTLADWMDTNIDAYQGYLELNQDIQQLQGIWRFIQDNYRKLHDKKAFPWPHNERFTSPVYSFLDPWLPGRENQGDTTAGIRDFQACLSEAEESDLEECVENGQNPAQCFQSQVPSCGGLAGAFESYSVCLEFIIKESAERGEGVLPSLDVCDRFIPEPPRLPQFPNIERDADLVLDFTAFREPQRTIKLPILKPIQIRINFSQIEPPPLDQDDEPTKYPELAELPAFPDSLSEDIINSLPIVINPAGADGLDSFKEAAILADTEDDPDDAFPKIEIPKADISSLFGFLLETYFLIEGMSREYEMFWKSLTLELCGGGDEEDCVRPNTEQDCVEPYNDEFKKCVHYEMDLNERFQRIGSRPAIFTWDDIRSAGKFRDSITQGQSYCEREDWACQLLNKYSRKPREGWMLDISEEYDPESLMQEIRTKVRDQSSNIFDVEGDRLLYDMPQEEMFENFRVPEGERIERRIEYFEPEE